MPVCWMVTKTKVANAASTVLSPKEAAMLVSTSGEISLRRAAEMTSVSHETIWQRVIRGGRYAEWKQLRISNWDPARSSAMRERKEKKALGRRLVDLLGNVVMDRREEGGFAFEKTIEYLHYSPRAYTPAARLECLFMTYKNALGERRVLSLTELSEISRVSPSNISKIFRAVKILPMYKLRKQLLKPHQEKAIMRSFCLEMSAEDIAYFTGVSPDTVNRRFQTMGARKKVCHPQFFEGKPYFLTIRRASQIFMAQDMAEKDCPEMDKGGLVKLVSELADAPLSAVDYAISSRAGLGSRVIGALDSMFPEEIHTTPYL